METQKLTTKLPNADQLDMFVETNGHVKHHSGRMLDEDIPADEEGMQALMRILASYMDEPLLDVIEAAYQVSRRAHATQYRKSGEPYITHPVAVATILADMRMDYQTIAAALMHDVIEDSEADRNLLAESFDETIANLVEGVSKISKLDTRSAKAAQAANFSKMLIAMNDDIRVIIVKLADRLHNMRTLGAMPAHKKREKSNETLEIYAPIANRLGMNSIRVELEDLAFANLHPLRYQTLKNQLEESRGSRDQLVVEVCESVQQELLQQGLNARVLGREKHLYGIYRKIRRKLHEKQLQGLRHTKNDFFRHVNDVYGIRVIVDDLHDCYRAMGVVHNLYRPRLTRFKDYIAIPKANGYQALHTAFYGPRNLPFECQIRTTEMDAMAEGGVAAHWHYKEGGDDGGAAPTRRWLGDLMELQRATGDSEEFLDNVKIDLFPDEVYVFSPKGDVFRLPRGATVIDYAYAVHTDLGNRVYGARVDGRRVMLRTELRSGQRVELLTDPNAHPETAWLNFVVTGKARAAIRQYQKNLHVEDAERIGKQMLRNALAGYGLKVTDMSDAITIMLNQWQLKSREELYVDIGLGRRLAPLVAKRLIEQKHQDESSGRLRLGDLFRRRNRAANDKPLMIKGSEGLAVQVAKCCYPLPGDPIVGYLSSGRGVVIHHAQCRTLGGVDDQPERWVEVEWAEEQTQDFAVPIDVQVSNQRGVLGGVAATISAASADIENVQVIERERARSALRFTVRVRNRKHLAEVFRSIRNTPQVKRVTRVKG